MTRTHAVSALALVSGTLATACLNPSTYSTPRTVPAHQVAVMAALDGLEVRTKAPSTVAAQYTYPSTDGVAHTSMPLPPTVIVRVGLGERTDIGIGAMSLASLGIDLKHTLVRGQVDLAIDPGLQVQPFSVNDRTNRDDQVLVAAHLPVILGYNVSREVSFVATAGLTLVPVGPTNDSDVLLIGAIGRDERALARGGLGLDFRVTQSMALHPEVTLLKGFQYETTVWIAGMGVTTGRLPSFD